jgi:hypothetical protein
MTSDNREATQELIDAARILLDREADETAKYAVRWLKALGAAQEHIDMMKDLHIDLARLVLAVQAVDKP